MASYDEVTQRIAWKLCGAFSDNYDLFVDMSYDLSVPGKNSSVWIHTTPTSAPFPHAPHYYITTTFQTTPFQK